VLADDKRCQPVYPGQSSIISRTSFEACRQDSYLCVDSKRVPGFAITLLGSLDTSSTLTAQTQPAALRQRKDRALLFATNQYQYWPPLINPVPDAQVIAQELEKSYGFETELVLNPTREIIVAKLREYAWRLTTWSAAPTSQARAETKRSWPSAYGYRRRQPAG